MMVTGEMGRFEEEEDVVYEDILFIFALWEWGRLKPHD
jgi:hypothetical protein